MKTFRMLLAMFAIVAAAGVGQAGYIVSVSDGNLLGYVAGSKPIYQPGGTAKLSVWLYDTVGGRSVNGYSLAFDLDTAGKGFDPAFSNFQVTFSSAFNNGAIFDRPADRPNADNYDFLMTTSLNPSTPIPSSSTSPIKLFDISFDISNSALAGIYDFVVVPEATDTGRRTINVNKFEPSSGDATFAGMGGQFEVNAVPEPSSLVLLGMGAGVLTFCRRRLRATRA